MKEPYPTSSPIHWSQLSYYLLALLLFISTGCESVTTSTTSEPEIYSTTYIRGRWKLHLLFSI